MIARSHKITDNTKIGQKIFLRREATKNFEHIRVLDLFAGNNRLWRSFQVEKYFGIEKEKGKGKGNLNADNIKVIPALDLSSYNVIDCDSYGMPVKQIDLIHKNKTLKKGTVIIYTAIGSPLSGTNKELIRMANLDQIYKKTKGLVNARSGELFYGFLYSLGVRTVYEYEVKGTAYKKRYGFYIVD